MKILLIAFDQTYDFIVPLLEEEGHEVRLLTKCERMPLIHSLKSTTYILEQIDEFEPENKSIWVVFDEESDIFGPRT